MRNTQNDNVSCRKALSFCCWKCNNISIWYVNCPHLSLTQFDTESGMITLYDKMVQTFMIAYVCWCQALCIVYVGVMSAYIHPFWMPCYWMLFCWIAEVFVRNVGNPWYREWIGRFSANVIVLPMYYIWKTYYSSKKWIHLVLQGILSLY